MSIKPLANFGSPGFANCSQLEIFEYESFNPATGWGSDLSEATDYPTKFSDETRSYRTIYSSVDDILCPTGFQFVGNWKIDRTSCDVDLEGWLYAGSFGAFSSGNTTMEMSSESLVRRRRWFRVIEDCFEAETAAALASSEAPSEGFQRSLSLRSEVSVEASVRTSQTSAVDHTASTLLTAIVFENERYMLSDWSCDNLMKGVDWPPWSDTTGVSGIDSLHDIDVLEGYEWMDSWHVDKLRGKTDCEGYYYAPSFKEMGRILDVKKATTDRRRRSMRRGSSNLQRAMEAVAEECENDDNEFAADLAEQYVSSARNGSGSPADGTEGRVGVNSSAPEGPADEAGGDFSVFDEERMHGRTQRALTTSTEDDSGGEEERLRGRGDGEWGGALFVRTRKWLRHMVRVESKDDVFCTPFELSVNILCLTPPITSDSTSKLAKNTSLYVDGGGSCGQGGSVDEEVMKLRVSIEVGDFIVGVTGEENYSKTAFRPSPDDLQKHAPGDFISWKDSMFQHPLVSLSPHPIRFKIYREMVRVGGIERAVRGELVAWAQDDETLLKEMWRKPNRKNIFKISISPSHHKMGFLWVELELVEHSVLYFAGQVPRKPALPVEITDIEDSRAKSLIPLDNKLQGETLTDDNASQHAATSLPLVASPRKESLSPQTIGELEKLVTRYVMNSVVSVYRNRSDGMCVMDPAEIPAWIIKNIVMSNAELFSSEEDRHYRPQPHHHTAGDKDSTCGGEDVLSLYEELCTCLLTLHRSDIRDVVEDLSMMYSTCATRENSDVVSSSLAVYPFPSALAHPGVMAYRSGTLDYPPDSAAIRRNSVFAATPAANTIMPPDRALYDCVPLTLPSETAQESASSQGTATAKPTTQRVYNASIVTASGRVYPFQWSDEVSYLTWMRVMSQYMRDGSGGPFSQVLRSSYFDQMNRSALPSSTRSSTSISSRALFDCADFEIIPSRGVLECTRIEGDESTSNGKSYSYSTTQPDGDRARSSLSTAQFSLSLSDIDHITTDSTFDYTRRYMLEMEVADLSVSGFRPGGEDLAIVTVTTSNGEVDYAQFYYKDLHTVSRRQNMSTNCVSSADTSQQPQQQLPKKMTIKIFVSADSLIQADDVLVSVHLCGEAEGIRTIGERRVTILDLVGESLLPKLRESDSLPGEKSSHYTTAINISTTDPTSGTVNDSSSGSNPSVTSSTNSSYLTGVVAVEPKKLNKASIARASAAASAALQSTATELCQNIQTERVLPLQAPRDAFIMRFVSADILLRLIKDLSPINSKSSEIFCTMTCVDGTGAAVGVSSGNVYRTSGAEVSSNVSWGQEAVFDKSSGFLRAAYAHIEVWHNTKTDLELTPLGEVYLPLKQLGDRYVEVKIALQWSPKMPLGFRTKYANIGSVTVGMKSVRNPAGGGSSTEIGVVHMKSSICLAPASAAAWYCRPLRSHPSPDHADSSTDHPTMEVSDCYFASLTGGALRLSAVTNTLEARSCWAQFRKLSSKRSTAGLAPGQPESPSSSARRLTAVGSSQALALRKQLTKKLSSTSNIIAASLSSGGAGASANSSIEYTALAAQEGSAAYSAYVANQPQPKSHLEPVVMSARMREMGPSAADVAYTMHGNCSGGVGLGRNGGGQNKKKTVSSPLCPYQDQSGSFVIPWNMVVDAEAVSDSAVIITLDISPLTRNERAASCNEQSKSVVDPADEVLSVVRMLLGPCPSKSVELLVRERMAGCGVRAMLQAEIGRLQNVQTPRPSLHLQAARDILVKLSFETKEAIRFLKLLHKKYVIFRRQQVRSDQTSHQQFTDIADFSATASPITTTPQEEKSKKKSILHLMMVNPHCTLASLMLQWSYSMARMFRLLLYTAALMKQCSLTCSAEIAKQTPSHFSEDGVSAHMEANTEYYEFQCFHSVYVESEANDAVDFEGAAMLGSVSSQTDDIYGAPLSTKVASLTSMPSVGEPKVVVNKTPNVGCISQFLDLVEGYVLDMILLGWNYFHRVDKILPLDDTISGSSSTPAVGKGGPFFGSESDVSSMQTRRSIIQQVASLAKQNIELTSPITPFLDILINGYYNRTVSLIGRCVWSFDKFETVRSKLELIHFVVTTDSRLAQSIVNALGVIGLKLTPAPTLSLSLRLDDLLDELPIVLYSEIESFLSAAVRNGKKEGDASHFPWTIHRLKGSLFIGPLPDEAYNILVLYMRLMAGLPGSASYTSHDDGRREEARLRNMNDVIAVQSLRGYLIVVAAYEGVLISLKQIVDTKSFVYSRQKQRADDCEHGGDLDDDADADWVQIEDAALQESVGHGSYATFICQSDDVSSILYFLCSVCNDCERICSSHLHLLSGRVLHPSNEFRAQLHKVETDLSYIGWTAAELITKVIFYDAEEAFASSFETVWLDQKSPLIPAMDTLKAYMADLKRFLTAEYLRKVVISCGRKLIHRYFIMLYAHGSEMEAYNTRMEKSVTEKLKLSSLLNRIPSFGFRRLEDQKQIQMEREAKELAEVRMQRVVFDMVHIQQMREDVERIATFCARTAHSVSPFQNSELSAQFDQINAFVWALELEYSESNPDEFMGAIRELVSLGGTFETVSCITLLKDLDRASSDAIVQLAFPDSQSVQTTPKSSFSTSSLGGPGYQYSRPAGSVSHSATTTPSEYISSGGRSLYGHSTGLLGLSTGSEIAIRARDKTYSDMLDAEEESLGLDVTAAVIADAASGGMDNVCLHQDDSSESMSLSEDEGEGEGSGGYHKLSPTAAQHTRSKHAGGLSTGRTYSGSSGSGSFSAIALPRVIHSVTANPGQYRTKGLDMGTSEVKVSQLWCRNLDAETALDLSGLDEQKLIVRVRCGSLRSQTSRARASTCPHWTDVLMFPCIKPPDILVLEVLKCEPRRHTRVDTVATCSILTTALLDTSTADGNSSLTLWVPLFPDEDSVSTAAGATSSLTGATVTAGQTSQPRTSVQQTQCGSKTLAPAQAVMARAEPNKDDTGQYGKDGKGGAINTPGMLLHACVEWIRLSPV